MHIYVINLARSPDRRIAMAAKLRGSKASIEFFDAIDGSAVDRNLFLMANGLSDGEVGCYLSHVGVWKMLVESKFDSALILEDDVDCQDDLHDLCEGFSSLPFDVHLIRLSSLKKAKGTEIWSRDARRLLIADMHPSGSQGYWLSRKGAIALLARMSMPSRELDKALDRSWRFGLRALLIDPPAVCEQAGAISLIPKRSSRKKPNWISRRLESLHRMVANNRQAKRLQVEIAKNWADLSDADRNALRLHLKPR